MNQKDKNKIIITADEMIKSLEKISNYNKKGANSHEVTIEIAKALAVVKCLKYDCSRVKKVITKGV